jgi:hypothetical protein
MIEIVFAFCIVSCTQFYVHALFITKLEKVLIRGHYSFLIDELHNAMNNI